MSVVSPGVKAVNADLGELLEGEDAKLFRSLTMRCSYLAEDRPDLRFATKEVARLMSTPCSMGMDRLKRIGRYLRGVPRLVQRFERHTAPSHIMAFSDSDHAGCIRTRKST